MSPIVSPGMSQYYSYWGLFQGLMPFYEQGNLANAFNYSSPSYFFATQDTVNAAHQAVLACPSDPEVLGGYGIYTSPGPGGWNYMMGLTSYRGINGPWYSPVRNCVGVIIGRVSAAGQPGPRHHLPRQRERDQFGHRWHQQHVAHA